MVQRRPFLFFLLRLVLAVNSDVRSKTTIVSGVSPIGGSGSEGSVSIGLAGVGQDPAGAWRFPVDWVRVGEAAWAIASLVARSLAGLRPTGAFHETSIELRHSALRARGQRSKPRMEPSRGTVPQEGSSSALA